VRFQQKTGHISETVKGMA